MFVSINDYLARIYNTLENVVAPEVESDFVRSQLFAAVALIGSLSKKIEYKKDLILDEINAGMEIIKAISDVLKESGIDIPENTMAFLDEFRENGLAADIKNIDRVNEQFRIALDFLYDRKSEISAEMYVHIDNKVRAYIHDISLRDVGFMPHVSFDKILRAGKE